VKADVGIGIGPASIQDSKDILLEKGRSGNRMEKTLFSLPLAPFLYFVPALLLNDQN
jgi:hypothetical protein